MQMRVRRTMVSFLLLTVALSSGEGGLHARQESSVDTAPGQSRTLLADGTWLLLGGREHASRAFIYDPRTRATRDAGSLQTGRVSHAATMLPDGSVLVTGGLDTNGRLVSTVERFTPVSGASVVLEDAGVTPRARHTTTLLSDGRVLIAGGETNGGALAEIVDVAAGTVLPVPGPPRRARLSAQARLRADGLVEISGGAESTTGPDEPDVFDPDLSSFVHPANAAPEPAQLGVAIIRPASNARVPAGDVRVAIRFTRPIDVRSTSSIELAGPDNQPNSAEIVIAESGMLLFVNPRRPLAPGTYELRLRRLQGASGAVGSPFASRFDVVADTAGGKSDVFDWQGDAKRALNSPWRKLPPLMGGAGVTALAGQVLLLDGEPLRDVTLSVGKRHVRTDRTGRFLIELGTAPSDWLEMVIEGKTANRAGHEYGLFEVAVQVVRGRTSALPYTIWMPRLDKANEVRVDSPTASEVVITTPHIPGLELHIPKGTVITDRDGKVVREVGITPMPADRPPFPLPSGVDVPVYFTIQPGGAYLSHTYGPGRKGPWLVYPNYGQDAPRTRAQFWHYDPEDKGWYVYGMGRVTQDARQVAPDTNVALYEFTGAMMVSWWSPPGTGPVGASSDGDPVDLATGLFVMNKTDLMLQDAIPLTLTRTYRQSDGASRPFGIGSSHPYAMFLWSADEYEEADLVLPDGKRIHYDRTSPGGSYIDAVFEHAATPGAFYKSVITWNGDGWDLLLRDGTTYVFGDMKPLQEIRDRFGNTLRVTWDVPDQTITKVTSPSGRFLAFTYDASNRIIEVKDNIGRAVEYEYDASGRLWKVTDARGGVTEYTYDIAHRMLTIEDARGIVYLENEYDTSGRAIKQTQADTGEYEFAYTVNGSGQITQTDVTNPRGYVRRVVFNGAGYPTSDISALGETVEQATSYARVSGTQQVETETDELGRITRYTYDTNGNTAGVTRLYGTADAVMTSYVYDSTYSLLTSITDPLSHTTTVAYDDQGRLQSSTNALTHQTTFGSNSAGQMVSVTTPLSKTTTFQYALGDLVSAQSPLGHTEARFVDEAGRVIWTKDAKGAVTAFEYDNHDQLTKITDPRGGETSFSYDGNGNLLTVTDARGKTTTWTYDDMDRVETRTDPLTRTETFAYDLNGNLITWTDRKGQVTTYQYDALDRQTFIGFGASGAPPTYASTITTTYDAGDRVTDIVDSVAGTIERTYDLLDRLTEEVTPEGTVSYEYDDAGRRTSMTVAGQTGVTYSYDNADRLTGVTRGTAGVTIAYDNADRRTSLTLPNGIVVEYGYDDDSRLTGLTYKQGSTTLGDLTYSYDAAGQRTTVGGTWARTNLPTALGSATYDDANQIATWGATAFTYDDNGNLTSDGVRSYTWDARNQLSSLTGPVSASFAYDGVGRRRSKTIGSTTTDFLYDRLNPVQELSAGSVVANLLTGLGIDEYFTRTDVSGVRNYLKDVLGSSVALADGSAVVQTEYTYEPFGGLTASGSSSASTFTYAGRELDGTGLAFYRARYYDPRLQRFLSEDPIGFAGGLNPFAYVSNAPISFTDPFGLKPQPTFAGAGGGTGAGSGGGGGKGGSGSGSGRRASGRRAGAGPASGGSDGGRGDSSDCEKPKCLDVFADCLASWVLPGWNDAAEQLTRAGASVQSIRAYNQALAHAAARGLTSPQKSSIVRTLFAQSRAWGKLAGGAVLTLINLDLGILHCLYIETREGLAGNCKP